MAPPDTTQHTNDAHDYDPIALLLFEFANGSDGRPARAGATLSVTSLLADDLLGPLLATQSS